MPKTQAMATWKLALLILGMLMSGTLNTLTTKIQFTLTSVGMDGEVEQFKKPWFGTLNMLQAMMYVLVVEQIFVGCTMCRKGHGMTVPLIDSPGGHTINNKQQPMSWGRKVLLVAIPAAFDLAATAFCCIGIIYIPASVWQILRGSAIVFCALFSVWFLQRRMYCFNYMGIFLCVVGVSLVGYASVMGSREESGAGGSNDATEAVFGMVLVLLGQVVQAAQVIAEEWLMKDVDLPAMQIVGFEGFWGVLMMLFIVYPILYFMPGDDHGSYESFYDTMVMISNNPQLMSIIAAYLFSCGTFNATGIAITGALSAVHRMMMDASRTTVIWAFGLYVHYFVDENSKFGESLTPYSSIQLAGFLVLVTGQAVYGEVLRIPGLYYPPKQAEVQQFSSPGALLNLSSPLPKNTPLDD
eukprot:TRINITY_DN3300_c0_g2_i1.p2 TRINITY_DN3300_c0_g2~~TRINITY_DN3300_c0_g2_i1.p2  ORF type:complete len:411 (+),score=99.16 TRINITY_DN3300_c0_g2_i1:66-1298(+)